MTHSAVATALKGLTRDGDSIVDTVIGVSSPDGVQRSMGDEYHQAQVYEQDALEFATRTRDDE